MVLSCWKNSQGINKYLLTESGIWYLHGTDCLLKRPYLKAFNGLLMSAVLKSWTYEPLCVIQVMKRRSEFIFWPKTILWFMWRWPCRCFYNCGIAILAYNWQLLQKYLTIKYTFCGSNKPTVWHKPNVVSNKEKISRIFFLSRKEDKQTSQYEPFPSMDDLS